MISALVRREPLGVIAAIVPWNYPLIISAWKIGPALLIGQFGGAEARRAIAADGDPTGRTGLAGRPSAGRANVVPGFGEEAGKALALHGDVDMVSFTGSTEVGKLMMRYAGESNLKRVALECGGKSPHIVIARCRPRRGRRTASPGASTTTPAKPVMPARA